MSEGADQADISLPASSEKFNVRSERTLRPYRDVALNYLSAILSAEWGERCARFESGCATCIAWAAFDMVEKITEGTTLDSREDFLRTTELFHLPSPPGAELNFSNDAERDQVSLKSDTLP